MKTKLIGISGRARAGKDTFADGLQEFLQDAHPNFTVNRYALADQIRRDLDEFLIPKFGVSLFEVPPEEKEVYRPLLIGYGTMMRAKTQNKYWWELLERQIMADDPDVAIISDIRFAENDNDEVSWIKKEGGLLVHINRTSSDPVTRDLPFGSKDEQTNEPYLKESSDYSFCWPTYPTNDELKSQTKDKVNEFYTKNINFFLK